MPFKLQYASNLFVDLTTHAFSKLVKPAAPHLALLGNIGRPESPKTYNFLRYCAKNWDSVVWVPGSHELSNPRDGRSTISERTINARALSKQVGGVTLMDSNELVFHEHRVVLLGTPLWSKVSLPPKGQPEFNTMFTSMDEAGPVPLSNTIRNKLHEQDMFFLKERSLFWSIVHPDVNLVFLTQSLPIPSLFVNQTHVSEEAWTRMTMDCVRTSMGPPVRAWLGGAGGITNRVNHGCIPDDQVICAVNSLHEYPFKASQNPRYDAECVVELKSKKPSRNRPEYLPTLVLPPLLSSLLQHKPSLAYA
jgi:hypothetical protein